MANFSSCAGIIVQSVKKVFLDMNMGPKETPGLLELEKPDAAIITHYHLDHSIWTGYVQGHSDAIVLIPEKEAPYLTSLDFVIEKTAGPFGMAKKWKDFVLTLGYRPLKAYIGYTEQTVLTDMVPEMVLVQTPGHSPSHTSFYFPDEKILFSGDMGLDRFGPWYGWADCNIKLMVESILRLDGIAVDLVLTSHGGIIKKEIQSAWAASILAILNREKIILQKLESGISKQEIIRQGVFFSDKEKVPEPMRSFLNMWDTAMFTHHESLIHEGGLMTFFPEIRGMSTS